MNNRHILTQNRLLIFGFLLLLTIATRNVSAYDLITSSGEDSGDVIQGWESTFLPLKYIMMVGDEAEFDSEPISAAEWESAVTNSFAAWSNITKSSISFHTYRRYKSSQYSFLC